MSLLQASSLQFDQVAWDLATRFALRPQLYFDRISTVKASNQEKPGHTVRFTFTADLAAATTPLTETADIVPVTYSDSTVDVVLAEYGNAVKSTALIRGTSMIPINPVTANVIGFNSGISFDTLARNALVGGTNVKFQGQTTQAAITATDTYKAASIRELVANLRTANVMDFGGYYVGFVHPDQAVDLRTESGTATWITPHVNVDTAEIYRGEIGSYEGVRFIETPRVALIADAGAANVDVYQSLILGQEALAKAWSKAVSAPMPQTVPGPVTDTLRRFVPIGWYWLGGFDSFREAALRRYETASSIGANA
jgi:N4-gp56 family major capsid protein